MVATSTTPNRIAPYLSESQKIEIPATREGREAVLADAVFAAIAALQGLLTHADPKVVMRAAEMILNLETTRQRHGRVMIGMELPECGPHTACAEIEPLAERAEHTPKAVNHADPLDVFVEKVRAELQSQEDADGTGVIVSREQAEECARFIQANAHCTPPFDPTPPGRGCHEPPARRERPMAPRQPLAPR
jgi:hypothetical protein